MLVSVYQYLRLNKVSVIGKNAMATPVNRINPLRIVCGSWALAITVFAFAFAIPQNARADMVAKGWEPLKEAVDAFFAPSAKPHSTGGVVIVMHRGERVFEGTYGAANREWDIPWQTTTQYWTASVAKSYAAQIVLHLADDGLVDLDAPVRDYVPDFPDYEVPVLVWHLLSMRSGLNEDSDSQFNSGNGIGGYGNPGMTKDEILDFIYSQPEPAFTPGKSKAQYENVTYSVLDRLIENVTGTHYMDALKKYITDPWGLKSTGAYEQNHFWALGDKAATAYISAEGQDIPNIETEMPFTYLHANGIMYFTANDFAEWAKRSAYGVNGETPMFERMINPPQLEGVTDSRYGFAIVRKDHRGYKTYGHTGYVGNLYFWAPELDLVVVSLTNEVGRYSYNGRFRSILDPAMSILNVEPANTHDAERPWPGRPLRKELKRSQKSMSRKLRGVFVDKEHGHVIASRKSDKGVIHHAHDGRTLTFFSYRPEDQWLTAFDSNGAQVKAVFDNDTVTLEGWGYEKPKTFTRVDPKPADDVAERSIMGLFYSTQWGSKFEIIHDKDGDLTLWNGDRSANGKRRLMRLTEEQWIAGSLEDADFWSLKFDKPVDGKINGFVLHTSTSRNVRFDRLVPVNRK